MPISFRRFWKLNGAVFTIVPLLNRARGFVLLRRFRKPLTHLFQFAAQPSRLRLGSIGALFLLFGALFCLFGALLGRLGEGGNEPTVGVVKPQPSRRLLYIRTRPRTQPELQLFAP